MGTINNFVVSLLIVARGSALLGDYAKPQRSGDRGVERDTGNCAGTPRRGALAALKKMAAPDAQVIRDGRRQSSPALRLIPGDIVSGSR